ncbi:capsular polysaccharide synthesis protein [Agrilactobacillus fermenti]|uniref:capsular polysaccharide synthesis protein n=1 Tax=Agrilactobacillus fermenti TaxID=2586909 RepID=UPI001E340C21|nr:capsular polysaccharide synthesis protein [Agrilactobacillus fermenti]MCD2255876.1 hypothetical protein [Agrilactobacillus fermenti]
MNKVVFTIKKISRMASRNLNNIGRIPTKIIFYQMLSLFISRVPNRFANSKSHIFKKRDKVILDNLKEYVPTYIPDEPLNSDKRFTVWSMWWQGTDNIPDLSQACFDSIARCCRKNNWRFVIITSENVHDYVFDLPSYIWEKLDNGQITITHFSDICRAYLLYHYGGLWADSTIFTTNIPKKIENEAFFTIKTSGYNNGYFIPNGRWTAFFMGTQAHNPLAYLLLHAFLNYWHQNEEMIDYFLIDYFIEIGCETQPTIQNLLNSVKSNNEFYNFFMVHGNDVFSREKFQRVERTGTTIFKLDLKAYIAQTKEVTFYSTLLNNHFMYIGDNDES